MRFSLSSNSPMRTAIARFSRSVKTPAAGQTSTVCGYGRRSGELCAGGGRHSRIADIFCQENARNLEGDNYKKDIPRDARTSATVDPISQGAPCEERPRRSLRRGRDEPWPGAEPPSKDEARGQPPS